MAEYKDNDRREDPGKPDDSFKYLLQDITNIYLGARYTYKELVEDEEHVPFKLQQVIYHYFLQEVDENTTPENHLFFLTRDSKSYEAYRKMKAVFRMSVYENGGKGRFGIIKKPGYVTKEYPLDEVVDSVELHQKMDTIIVEEVRISKMGLGRILL